MNLKNFHQTKPAKAITWKAIYT